jgi:hypothetical protein
MRAMKAESETRTGTIKDREADRFGIAAQVQFRAGTRRANVQVSDISTKGARLAGVFLHQPGERFYLKFEGFETIEARVAWAEDFAIGCSFVTPLHPAVLDMVRSRRNAGPAAA